MGLTIDDLFVKCDKCGGSGHMEETSGSATIKYTRSGTCDKCGGTGGRLTETGKAIKELFEILKKGTL